MIYDFYNSTSLSYITVKCWWALFKFSFSMFHLLEHIVMTPKCKTANSTTLVIERQALEPPTENGNENNVHIAGGDHKGIVINKQAIAGT